MNHFVVNLNKVEGFKSLKRLERLERLERTDPRDERSKAVERLERLERASVCLRSSISTPSLSRTPILQTYIEESRSYPVRIPGGPASDVSTAIYTHVLNRGRDRFLSRSGILRFRRPVYKGMSRSQKSLTRH